MCDHEAPADLPPADPTLPRLAMFRPTEPQLSLMESRFLIPPAKRERLERSWAEAFRCRILPLINEEAFRSCFCENNGRPNKSIRLLVCLHLLKEADDLTDEQVLDALEFNVQWQHALGVEPADAHVSEKTLHNFRRRLMENGLAQVVFVELTAALIAVDGLSPVRQRLDSTHVISNIAVLTRLGLFTETVTTFLRDLRKLEPGKLADLHSDFAKRYLDREGFFADVRREQAMRRLPIAAKDLYSLVRAFEGDAAIQLWPSYANMARLLADQCDIVKPDAESAAEGQGAVQVKDGKEVAGTSLQSPHDPDATYGHKGKGYEVQLCETCVPENPYQVVTAVVLTGAHESDQRVTIPLVEALIEQGVGPEVLHTDTAYGSGEAIVACAALGVELVARVQDPSAPPRPDDWEPSAQVPVPGSDASPAPVAPGPDASAPGTAAPDAPLGLEDFRFNATFNEVVECPAGHRPDGNEPAKGRQAFQAHFDSTTCAGCPLRDRCPTRPGPDGDRTMRYRADKAATATRQREQRGAEFRTRNKVRSGIEATNAEFKGRHGAGALRVRRRSRVAVAVTLKALALNTKRAVQHHQKGLRDRLGTEIRQAA